MKGAWKRAFAGCGNSAQGAVSARPPVMSRRRGIARLPHCETGSVASADNSPSLTCGALALALVNDNKSHEKWPLLVSWSRGLDGGSDQ